MLPGARTWGFGGRCASSPPIRKTMRARLGSCARSSPDPASPGEAECCTERTSAPFVPVGTGGTAVLAFVVMVAWGRPYAAGRVSAAAQPPGPARWFTIDWLPTSRTGWAPFSDRDGELTGAARNRLFPPTPRARQADGRNGHHRSRGDLLHRRGRSRRASALSAAPTGRRV